MQSLKSAQQVRVNLDQANRMAQERILLGNSTANGRSGLCGAGWNDLNFDIYMRPADQTTLKLDSPACNGGGIWSAARRIEVENVERPYVPICAAGFRGGDTAGVARDIMPTELYDNSGRGRFVRHYNTPNNMNPKPSPACGCCSNAPHIIPRYDLSMDAKQRRAVL
jgi:hypothetical protein